MKIITIIGARPQFIKAAMVSRAVQQKAQQGFAIEEKILHTGQHYDYNMSSIFFDEMQIPATAWHLGCSSDVQEMKRAIVPIVRGNADYILVYGDTNSTLAGALAAEECKIPLIHIEAGLRSHNMQMAEEYNRIETDRRSQVLFCPTSTAVQNLKTEGVPGKIFKSGDVMYDAAIVFGRIADQRATVLSELALASGKYLLATIHRAENTASPEALMSIFRAFEQLPLPVILPLHPRTRHVVDGDSDLSRFMAQAKNIRVIEPVSYINMVQLEKHAFRILTDSGGVQKEAYFHGVPCITLRHETEWIETVEAGWNVLAGTDTQRILSAYDTPFRKEKIAEYGTGRASEEIVDLLCQNAC
jgi:UDP-GlcNAc3NAcA epimerase